jgi:hypothetical protein
MSNYNLKIILLIDKICNLGFVKSNLWKEGIFLSNQL